MKRSAGQDLPRARRDDLVTRQVRDELLIYDLKRHKAFCLNETAALVWKSCNGRRSVTDLVRELDKNRKSLDEKVIWLALDQLEKSNLLQRKISRPLDLPRVSRRDLIRIGIAGAVALPIVIAISAPTAQAAGSPITSAICQARHNSDPGGCGLNPCSDAIGLCLRNGLSNACRCT